ncbi:MAG TPA: SCO family protein [Flavobacteriales bacterium]|jgi:protein SCO1/2|nr:SCO family protein [Flavobacteriales bacterium]HIK62429.1 SCO family protein [Flavobacteriales bacterium]
MKLDKIILLFLLLVLPGLMYFYVTRGYNNFIKLEIIGEEGYSIDEFSFINQNNDTITKDSLTGSIYVANFFFTSCPSICPIMTKNMSYLQEKLSVYPDIRFLSHTVDPDNDTPEKLNSYINLMQQKNISIDLSNWDFLTGDKDKLYQTAANYFVNASADSLAPGGFLHSEYFILIDKQGRVRSGIDKNGNAVGAYDGTNEAQIKDLINDIKVLMAEYKKPKKDDKD